MENNKIKLIGMTLVYNESVMIPYIMPYYEKLGYDKLIVYDNESTDNTVELLKKYPFIEIRTFKTGGLDDSTNKRLKEEFIKEHAGEKNTWMTVNDFDEVLFYDGDIKEYLFNNGKDGYGYLSQFMVQPYSKTFPPKDKLVHNYTERGSFWKRNGHNFWENGCKTILFNCEKIKSVSYTPGCHRCTINLNDKNAKNLINNGIYSFHIKFLDYDFILKKMAFADKNRSEKNKRARYGSEYERLKRPEIFAKAWAVLEKDSFLISEYIEGKHKSELSNRFVTRI